MSVLITEVECGESGVGKGQGGETSSGLFSEVSNLSECLFHRLPSFTLMRKDNGPF